MLLILTNLGPCHKWKINPPPPPPPLPQLSISVEQAVVMLYPSAYLQIKYSNTISPKTIQVEGSLLSVM